MTPDLTRERTSTCTTCRSSSTVSQRCASARHIRNADHLGRHHAHDPLTHPRRQSPGPPRSHLTGPPNVIRTGDQPSSARIPLRAGHPACPPQQKPLQHERDHQQHSWQAMVDHARIMGGKITNGCCGCDPAGRLSPCASAGGTGADDRGRDGQDAQEDRSGPVARHDQMISRSALQLQNIPEITNRLLGVDFTLSARLSTDSWDVGSGVGEVAEAVGACGAGGLSMGRMATYSCLIPG